MSGWHDDCESAMLAMQDALVSLNDIDPGNPLLSYQLITDPDPFGGNEEMARKAMKDRFWQREDSWQDAPGVMVTTVVTSNYAMALRAETERLLAHATPVQIQGES